MRYDVDIAAIERLGFVAVEASEHGLERACAAMGASLPQGARSVAGASGLMHRSGPESLVIVTDAADASSLAGRLQDAVEESSAIVADLSDAHEGIRMAGPDVVAALAQGVAIDLRLGAWAPGQAARTLCFGVEVLIIRDAPDAFRLICRASYRDFLLARLRLAAAPLQGEAAWR